MIEICPSCGGNKMIALGNNVYQCRYCNQQFTDNAVQQPQMAFQQGSPATITIHGYPQWFVFSPDVKVYINGQMIGSVARKGTLPINITAPCQIVFKSSMRSAKINVTPSIDTDIYLAFNRFTGSLSAISAGANDNVSFDKPSIGLSILCFLVPLVGLILFFKTKGEEPASAKVYLICAICGFILSLILFNS